MAPAAGRVRVAHPAHGDDGRSADDAHVHRVRSRRLRTGTANKRFQVSGNRRITTNGLQPCVSSHENFVSNVGVWVSADCHSCLVSVLQIVGVCAEELKAAQHWNGPGVIDLLKKSPT